MTQAAAPTQHAAASAVRHSEEPVPPLGPLSTAEKQGYGCLVAGSVSLAAASYVGTTNALLMYTGASALPAANPVGLGLAVASTIFASTCAVGALVAPTAIRLWRYYYDGAEIVEAR